MSAFPDASVAASDDLFQRLEELNSIGVALSRERDLPRLLERILIAAKDITRSDAGTLYRKTEDDRLRFEIFRNDTLGIAMGGTTGQEISYYPVHLTGKDGKPNNAMVVAYAALHDQTVNIADAYVAEGFDFTGTRQFDAKTGYRSKSFLTVPMKDHEGEIIGVLQLINATDRRTGEIVPFSASDQRLVESLASQAAIALTNRQLINQLETLFESFITLINAAIDEKSPYTGGHCQRVPELTMMLAEAARRTREGPLADFDLGEKDLYELRIAGLLHDCGKVTTPVHVVDKATKLQTLFDRIHLVDQRFEILRRDAEIELLNARLRGDADMASREHRHAVRLQELEADREFLRRCNMGDESMPEADRRRVRDIAERHRWRGPDGSEQAFLTEDEIENLTIPRGTLTAEEREQINHHIVVTIRMLESLPWPRHLQKVPEYAGGHHERMDGRGYPRGLTREQMSVPARIMGIADIFEALTAVDRPYKRGKTLSEALRIMGQFRLDGHLDPDLFDVFVREKVYLEYARRFLEPEQIDAVDERRIAGYRGG